MKFTKAALLLSAYIAFAACHELNQVVKELESYDASQNQTPSIAEMTNGLKAALEKGTIKGVGELAQKGGYFNYPEFKIPFPPSAERVRNSLIKTGFDKQVNQVVASLNEAAEQAVTAAKPLFIDAIKNMTIDDVKGILLGSDTAATTYLKKNTSMGLATEFRPIIQQSLDQVNATKYWADIIGIYNRIPLVDKVNTDLAGFVTNRAIRGLFVKVAREEMAIRKNPIDRTTELLKKVFSYAEREKSNSN